ncbi:hypothetical protein [Nocardioides lijunqiniae]|uniref:hypothetical protein n=1 Tax=Nocardioides lijunqiniae TaxID=2760832 RepID=UPI001878165A|nr:hypothetical protein [Nocardioides lijunqiniae]
MTTKSFVARTSCGAMVLASAGCLVACGEDSTDSGGSPSASESPRRGSRPTAEFSARLNGPSTAEPGSVVILSVSNVGRLRDTYELTVRPSGDGKARPRHLTVEPGRTGKFRVKVRRVPLTVAVEGSGAGPGADELTIE